MADRVAAAQLGLCLLVFALALAALERMGSAARAITSGTRASGRAALNSIGSHRLAGLAATALRAAGAAGLSLPGLIMLWRWPDAGRPAFWPRYLGFIGAIR
jgi:hypothetical protein